MIELNDEKGGHFPILQLNFNTTASWLQFGHSCAFQKDNDPKDISKLVSEWIKQATVRL